MCDNKVRKVLNFGSGYFPMSLQTLLESLPDLSPNDRSLIERAYHKAEAGHAGQRRRSGQPYFTHCEAVAQILADMKLDAEAIAAALMHDLLEDTPVTLEEIRAEFGQSVAMMVDGVTKLKNLPTTKATSDNGHNRRSRDSDRELEYIRKMVLAMGDDVRVVLVKLADRLHNMRTLGFMPVDKQKLIAQETLDIFAPLANRLGIWQIKWELEDLSFRYLLPDEYKQIATSIDERRADREAYINTVTALLRQELEKHNITNAVITGRPKHIYSIYAKMERKKLSFDKIYDVRAVRVIVDTVPQCYLVLGIVHNLWRPIPGEFDDYIAAPKDNFYQSLHTSLLDERGKTVEVQIRTWEMHEHAEYGIAAHWRYKEGRRKSRDEDFERRLRYLRRLMEFRHETDDAESFVNTMKSEVFQDRVYAFTPKGDIYDLPVGSTPIDFAYHVHTEIGHRCRGARVHGRLVSLNYSLKTGDQVEIITSKRGGPSLDWLNPNLGYVKTTRARAKIRYWFRKQNREKHLASGRELLERELRRMGVVDTMTFDAVAALFNFERADDFLVAVGAGDINSSQIASHIMDAERKSAHLQQESRELLKPRPKSSALTLTDDNGIHIKGVGGLLTSLARCCNPMQGDKIIGYITRGRGVTVHRQDCANMVSGNVEPERLIEVTWESVKEEQRYSVPVEIIAFDREGLMRDISTIIAEEKVNMTALNVATSQNIATLQLTIEISGVDQLSRILNRLYGVEDVVEARRRLMS
jgi:RelA/SpoT family (p)ppGpp synthetase